MTRRELTARNRRLVESARLREQAALLEADRKNKAVSEQETRERQERMKIPVQTHFKNLHSRSPKPYRRLLASMAYFQLKAWGYLV